MALTKNPAPLAAGRAWNAVASLLSTPHFIVQIAYSLNSNFVAVLATNPALLLALGNLLIGEAPQ